MGVSGWWRCFSKKKWYTLGYISSLVCLYLIVKESSVVRQSQKMTRMIPTGNYNGIMTNQPLNSMQSSSQISEDDAKLESVLSNSNIKCDNLKRPTLEGVKYRNGYWQMSEKDGNEIFLYSAFYDDRPINNQHRYIRMMTVAKLAKGVTPYCQLWYVGHDRPFITKVIILKTGRGHNISGVHYGQVEYSCELPGSKLVPSHVSVVTEPCLDSIIFLPVTLPERTQKHEFAICVAIAFGKIPVPQFVEWIELNRIFGVTEFNVYDGNMDKEMKDVFQYYQNLGFLNVVPMPPAVMDFTTNGVKLSSPASLNDCMLRNMYRYKYMIVIDFDEFIVPYQHNNYSAMIQAIDHAEKVSAFKSYTFRNGYFFNAFDQDVSQPAFLRTMQFRNRVDINRYMFVPKSFTDPRKCRSVFNHYCYRRFSGKGRWTIDVKPSIAFSHHYRKCNLGTSKCNKLFKQKQKDDYILKFKHKLQENVLRVFSDIGWKE